MMKTFAKWALSGFSKRYDYDVSYLHEMAAVTPSAFMKYLLATPLSQHCSAAPKDAYLAAKLVATRRADCGSCLQLVVNMAREAGMDDATLRAVIIGDVDQVANDIKLAMQYAEAVIDQSAVQVTGLGGQVVSRWGQSGRTDLALAITFGSFFPTLKRGLGHAESCEPVLQRLVAESK